MMTPANMPNDWIGIIGLKALTKKATADVLDVTAMALTALRQLYAILFFLSPANCFIFSLCLQASMNTKISSAAIPRTMKINKVCNELKKVTLRIPSVTRTVMGS